MQLWARGNVSRVCGDGDGPEEHLPFEEQKICGCEFPPPDAASHHPATSHTAHIPNHHGRRKEGKGQKSTAERGRK